MSRCSSSPKHRSPMRNAKQPPDLLLDLLIEEFLYAYQQPGSAKTVDNGIPTDAAGSGDGLE